MTSPPKKSPTVRKTKIPSPDRRGGDPWKHNPELIKKFLGARRDYEQLCAEVEYILRKRITESDIEIASVTSRAKTLDSFLEKLQRKNYTDPFKSIHDFAGARAVCLYRADIDKISEIIRSEFSIVEEVNKLDELGVDQFGYGASHFVVRLGKDSSGARYDDLKQLSCEIQVRTVVQDAWAIIQHHMVYKREAQVPSKLQRKLNSLSGLFETVDDQFERIREERDSYLADIRESANTPTTFLENELNLDSFKEYLAWAFPGRAIESFDGQSRVVLDGLINGGYKTLGEVHNIVESTKIKREAMLKESIDSIKKAADGTLPANLEPALALAFTAKQWETLIPWGKDWRERIHRYR